MGADDWTTPPDKNDGTSSDVPAECEAGFFVDMHPFLEHYLTAVGRRAGRARGGRTLSVPGFFKYTWRAPGTKL